MMLLALSLTLSSTSTAAPCECAAKLLEAAEQRWSARFDSLHARLSAVEADNASLRRQLDAAGTMRVAGAMDVDGSERRLSSSGSVSYVAVKHPILHQFPDSHSCPNVVADAAKAALPIDGAGAVSWSDSPTVVADELSLISVSGYWQPNEIQRFPAPFKMVHDASCAHEPSLTVPLNTTIEGTLTAAGELMVAGIEVGAKLAALSGSWQNIPINGGAASGAWGYRGEIAQYLVRDGLVFLRGGVGADGGASMNSGDTFCQLPLGARPAQLAVAAVGVMGNANMARIHLNTDGTITYQGSSSNIDNVYLDGVVFGAA